MSEKESASVPFLHRRRVLISLLSALTLATAPASASASAKAIIVDCQDGQMDGKYSQREYAQALKNIPTDVDEYTNCRDVIRRAQLGAASAGGSKRSGSGGGAPGMPGGTGGGAAPIVPAGEFATTDEVLAGASAKERADVEAAIAKGGGAPVQLGTGFVSPDTSAFSPDGAANTVPTPLLVALVLLGIGLLAGAALTARSRVFDRRPPAV